MKKLLTLPSRMRLVLGALLCFLAISTTSLKAQTYAKGADVSWLDQMEASGYKFYNNNGTQQDLFTILKGKGMNSIRLRVWVKPTGGWCDKADMLWMAKRAKAAGMRIMVDFHYSDTWADPGQQNKPVAWRTYDLNGLMKAVYDHTYDVMNTLKANGIYPEWAQVGNETNNGMLWEQGRASVNMKNFAWLVNSGYNAIKAVNSGTKVIVHLSNANDNAMYRWMFDGLRANGAKWDIIGMSVYPTTSNWASNNTAAFNNMKDMVARYGSSIMICEAGMDVTAAATCKSFLTDLINKNRSLPSGKGLGVFYWEPQCYNNWQGYGKGAFGSNGRPTVALDAFLLNTGRTALENEIVQNTDVFKAFPNPYLNELTIEYTLEKNQAVAVTLYDGKGNVKKQLVNEVQTKGAYSLAIKENIEPGIYFVKITHGSYSAVRKVIKLQ